MGIDESGRGPWAGPVVVCGVVLDPHKPISGLKDSKKLSAKQREKLRELILANALLVIIKEIEVDVIDKINILAATLKAMALVIKEALSHHLPLEKVWIDGNHVPIIDDPIVLHPLIKGDNIIPSIMAAAIVAKTHRDNLMYNLDKLYPHYGFKDHKGYGTLKHREAIKKFGPCVEHRMSFSPLKDKIWL